MTPFRATVAEVVEAVGGTLRGPVDQTVELNAVTTDTRRLPPPPFLFVALRGPNFDGNAFAAEAARAGAGLVVVSSPSAVEGSVPSLLVDDGLGALQALAGWWRRRFTGQVVAITGSNGKTVSKEMLAAVLAPQRRVYRSPGSFNSQVGVALSLLSMPLDAEVALIECGVSRPGEMDRLQAMVRPDLGMLTNVGTAHLAGFGTPEQIAREKLRLFRGMSGPLVIHESAEPYRRSAPPEPVLHWVGRAEGRASMLKSVTPVADGNRVWLQLAPNRTLDVRLASFAEHDADNAIGVAALAARLGLAVDAIGD